ncbi:uncharacterized protein LOC135400791 [Ornithodoros turicata]|uniref:uncharacterized protein LOC135400791 n=1 Tax=Ornithodoros turicata TaxID=34597 RepID=UPI003139C522
MAFAAALVDFTNKDEREHPQLMELLGKLRTKMIVDGTSIDVHKELHQASCEREQAVKKYCEALVLKEACNNIMAQDHVVEGENSENENEENDTLTQEQGAFEKQFENWYDHIRLRDCASLGITKFEIPNLPPVKEEFVKTTVIPLIEADLERQSQAIIDALDALYSVDEVEHVVNSMVEDMKSLRQQLQILRLEHARMLLSFRQVLEDHLKSNVEAPVSSAALECLGTEAECLRDETVCFLAKMSLTCDELYVDIYSKEKVEALAHIRKELKKKMIFCKQNIKEMKETLEKFKQLKSWIFEKIEEYGSLKTEADHIRRVTAAYYS